MYSSNSPSPAEARARAPDLLCDSALGHLEIVLEDRPRLIQVSTSASVRPVQFMVPGL